MSFGGLLATALAGGAAVIGKQAGDDIEQGRKAELMRQEAEIRAQTEMRLMERRALVARQSNKDIQGDNLAFEASDDTLAKRGTIAQAAGKTARQVKLDDVTDIPLNTALRAKTRDDAEAEHAIKVDQAIRDSGNPSLLKAMADLETASPIKATEIRLKGAQAGEAAAKGREADARAGYFKAGGATQGRGVGGKAEKMDESDKIEYQSLFGEVKTALANQAKFEAEGQPLDGNSQPTAQYRIVQGNVTAARRRLERFQMKNGILDPDDLADAAVSGETDSGKIGTAIAQAYANGGTEFGDKFFARVRASGALERNAERETTKPTKPGLLKSTRGNDDPSSLSSLYGTPKDAVDNARDFLRPLLEEGSKAGYSIEALRAKVRSGQALTPDETTMARRYGMGV